MGRGRSCDISRIRGHPVSDPILRRPGGWPICHVSSEWRTIALLISVAVLGLLASLNPMRPVVFVMVLRTDRALVNAVAFLFGWIASLLALFVIGFAVVGGGVSGHPRGPEKTGAAVGELLVALALLFLAARRWRRRNDVTVRRTAPEAILRRLDRLNPRSARILGVLIQPWTLTLGAALIVARERSGVLSAISGLLVFALFSTGALLAIFTYFVRRPDSAQSRLASVTSRLELAGPTILTLVCGVGGVYLFVNALLALTS